MKSSEQPPENTNTSKKDNFFYPTSSYQGKFTPEQLIFNANLQEFAQRVSILCALETGGKIPPEQTYREIKTLWTALKNSKRNLLDQERPDPPELPDDGGFLSEVDFSAEAPAASPLDNGQDGNTDNANDSSEADDEEGDENLGADDSVPKA